MSSFVSFSEVPPKHSAVSTYLTFVLYAWYIDCSLLWILCILDISIKASGMLGICLLEVLVGHSECGDGRGVHPCSNRPGPMQVPFSPLSVVSIWLLHYAPACGGYQLPQLLLFPCSEGSAVLGSAAGHRPPTPACLWGAPWIQPAARAGLPPANRTHI